MARNGTTSRTLRITDYSIDSESGHDSGTNGTPFPLTYVPLTHSRSESAYVSLGRRLVGDDVFTYRTCYIELSDRHFDSQFNVSTKLSCCVQNMVKTGREPASGSRARHRG